MIVSPSTNSAKVFGNNDIVNYSFSDNQSPLFSALSKSLYEYPYHAVVRELTANMVDIHNESGNDSPVGISFDSENKIITFRDFGTGLNKEDFAGYACFGLSSKGATNESIGGFGIGSKSPFSIADEFFINSYFNGTVYSYRIFVNESNTEYTLEAEGQTSEPNGLEIIVPFNQSVTDAINIIHGECGFFDVGYDLTVDGEKVEVDTSIDNIYYENSHVVVTNPVSGFFRGGCRKVLMAGVLYDIQEDIVNKSEKLTSFFRDYGYLRYGTDRSIFALKADNGSLTVTRSRENIMDNINNIEQLELLVDGAIESFKCDFKEKWGEELSIEAIEANMFNHAKDSPHKHTIIYRTLAELIGDYHFLSNCFDIGGNHRHNQYFCRKLDIDSRIYDSSCLPKRRLSKFPGLIAIVNKKNKSYIDIAKKMASIKSSSKYVIIDLNHRDFNEVKKSIIDAHPVLKLSTFLSEKDFGDFFNTNKRSLLSLTGTTMNGCRVKLDGNIQDYIIKERDVEYDDKDQKLDYLVKRSGKYKGILCVTNKTAERLSKELKGFKDYNELIKECKDTVLDIISQEKDIDRYISLRLTKNNIAPNYNEYNICYSVSNTILESCFIPEMFGDINLSDLESYIGHLDLADLFVASDYTHLFEEVKTQFKDYLDRLILERPYIKLFSYNGWLGRDNWDKALLSYIDNGVVN